MCDTYERSRIELLPRPDSLKDTIDDLAVACPGRTLYTRLSVYDSFAIQTHGLPRFFSCELVFLLFSTQDRLIFPSNPPEARRAQVKHDHIHGCVCST